MDYERDYPKDWSQFEIEQWEAITEWSNARYDDSLQALYHESLFNFDSGLSYDERTAIREHLNELLEDDWGIDFDAEFDWEDYRAWYDTA